MMSDCEEETDFFCQSWTFPAKTKTKEKVSRKCPKSKSKTTTERDENGQKKKKKKSAKFKEAMEGRKEKKKEKKKKKKKRSDLDDSFLLTQYRSAGEHPTLHPRGNDQPDPDGLTHDSKKKSKRKKKVEFDLSAGDVRVKRPKCVSSCEQQSPRESIQAESSCPQVTVADHSDSQCTSDDINSQDLFITQKTFREPPSEPSSCEAGDKAINTTLLVLTQHPETSHKLPPDSHLQQRHGRTMEPVQKPKTVQVLLVEEEKKEGLKKANQNRKKEKSSYQGKLQFNTNLTQVRKASRPVHTKPRVGNPFLDEPVVVTDSPDVVQTEKHSSSSTQQSPWCPQHTDKPSVPPCVSSTGTQTENFFTTRLSTYLDFCQKSRATADLEDLKPLDLSLAHRAREDQGKAWSSLPGERHKEPKPHPPLSGPQACSVSGKGGTTPSPQSESEPKSADTTTSSEDNEPPCRSSKLDLAQVRAVQMRLNGSFFFKSKGEGTSPRAASPLMKLCQGRELNTKKAH